MNQSVHGGVGTREQQFTHLLPLRKKPYLIDLLCALADKMKSIPDDAHDGADPEENIWVPAGYTYLGQFIDHDLTFDNTSSLNPVDSGINDRIPTNLRTPRFDLDSLYGDGPDAQPFLYDNDNASLLFKDGDRNKIAFTEPVADQAKQDLLRSTNGRAIIGDKRNDENVIVGQLQLLFVKYHNVVVKKLSERDPALKGTALFEKARNEVRWTYQKLVVEDFLPRIVRREVFEDLSLAPSPDERVHHYALYTPDKRSNLPREFVVAAYRFGHSGVRQGYRLNKEQDPLSIFMGTGDKAKPDDLTLLGFKPLPENLSIKIEDDDFERFFSPTGPDETFLLAGKSDRKANEVPETTGNLQFAYKIDTNIVDPLSALPFNILPTSSSKGGLIEELNQTIAPNQLPKTPPTPPPPADQRPSLALLNLLRGNIYRVQSGQEVARVLRSHGLKKAVTLAHDQLAIRVGTETSNGIEYHFDAIPSPLLDDTPLWLYILAEAQAPVFDAFRDKASFSEDELLNGPGASTQLGWVGGRIVAEVFYGLLDSDDESFVNAAPTGWTPILGPEASNRPPVFLDLVNFVKTSYVPVPSNVLPTQEKTDSAVGVAEAVAGGETK